MDSTGLESGRRVGAADRPRAGVLAHERWFVRGLLRRLGDPPVVVVLWNGEEIGTGGGGVRVVLRERGALYKLLWEPGFQFGELYCAGRIEVEGDLVGLVEVVNRGQLRGGTRAGGWLGKVPRNTRGRSRLNVHHHYDIGNEFYRLWLDKEMLYTCAYFERAEMTLEEAQIAKLEHVCRKLRLKAGETVVEAGCGWGGLALYMARQHGVKVRAFNISREQIAYARGRAAAEGLSGQVEFVEDDYRNISGTFDAFVSVGMLEHVGPRHYRELGAVIDRSLTAEGRGLIHSIGRPWPAPIDAWTAARIFPGAYPPSLAEMTEIFEPNGLAVLDVENLRLHYAVTLRHWLERFEANQGRVAKMFDERFVRMWRLYLASSQAAFTTGWLQLFQVSFNRVTSKVAPWTRKDLYCGGKA